MHMIFATDTHYVQSVVASCVTLSVDRIPAEFKDLYHYNPSVVGTILDHTNWTHWWCTSLLLQLTYQLRYKAYQNPVDLQKKIQQFYLGEKMAVAAAADIFGNCDNE